MKLHVVLFAIQLNDAALGNCSLRFSNAIPRRLAREKKLRFCNNKLPLSDIGPHPSMRFSKTLPGNKKPKVDPKLIASEPAKRRGRKPDPIIEYPEPLFTDWIEPTCFDKALCLQMNRHGDTYYRLWRAIIRPGKN
jgi:hypothetical protein